MNISIKEFKTKNNINIIDIRSVEKYNENHIENAINIPHLKLLENPVKYLNKNDEYYLYCQYGIKSYKLCQILINQGYKVYNILGGYIAWIIEN